MIIGPVKVSFVTLVDNVRASIYACVCVYTQQTDVNNERRAFTFALLSCSGASRSRVKVHARLSAQRTFFLSFSQRERLSFSQSRARERGSSRRCVYLENALIYIYIYIYAQSEPRRREPIRRFNYRSSLVIAREFSNAPERVFVL